MDVDDFDGSFSSGLDRSDGDRATFAVLCSEVELGGLSGVSVLDFGDFGDVDVLADLSFDLADNLLDLSFVVVSSWH